MTDSRPTSSRFDVLSRSDSGLHYVREKKRGILRVLTDSEFADFNNDPPPCPLCAEQFGCDHFNCAGEALFTDAEIESEVPEQWRAFAKEHGVSRADLGRLECVELHEEAYRLAPGAPTDMRALELVLLLNDR